MWFVIFVFCIGLVSSSFSFSSPYNQNNPLVVEPGRIKEFEARLTNPSVDTSRVELSFLEGREIARFLGDTIFELKTGDIVMVPIEIKVPVNAEAEYEVKILSDSLDSGEEGKVQLSPSYVTSFFVLTGESLKDIGINRKGGDAEVGKESELESIDTFFNLAYLIISLMIVVLILIIFVYVRRRRSNLAFESLRQPPIAERNV